MSAPESRAAGLRVAFVPGVILTKWRRVWAERFPRVPLDTFEVPESEQRSILDAGAAEFCFARLPTDADGLHVIRLYEEQPVVWVAKTHPISLFDELSSADLVDEDVRTEATEFAIDLVALGEAVLRVPLSVARAQSRRDLVHRPVTDADPTTIALTWRREADNPWIDEFVGVVRGRTANSSRSAAERSRTPADAVTPAPAPRRPQRRTPPPQHRSTRRRGR